MSEQSVSEQSVTCFSGHEFKDLYDVLKFITKSGLPVEVFDAFLFAYKENGCTDIFEALDFARREWDV